MILQLYQKSLKIVFLFHIKHKGTTFHTSLLWCLLKLPFEHAKNSHWTKHSQEILIRRKLTTELPSNNILKKNVINSLSTYFSHMAPINKDSLMHRLAIVKIFTLGHCPSLKSYFCWNLCLINSVSWEISHLISLQRPK